MGKTQASIGVSSAALEASGRTLRDVANELAGRLDADILFYNAPIDPPFDRHVMTNCRKRRRRKNVFLVMVTLGGDADVAYRMAKCLQSKYEQVYFFVTGYCKSAGTLVALAAHQLIIADHGELGPLDVQMSKPDTLFEAQTGLTVNTSLTALNDQAYLAFEHFFMETEKKSEGVITVKTASEIATRLAGSLFAPLYAQIDPIHVGEAARAMSVAEHYGRLLMRASRNYGADQLKLLISHYPSHSFVVDRDEAKTIFKNVREPTALETELADRLGVNAVVPLPNAESRKVMIEFLSQEFQPKPRKKAIAKSPKTEKTESVQALAATGEKHGNGGPGKSARATTH